MDRHSTSPAAPAVRRGLYPENEPFETGWMSVGGAHEVYYEVCGHPRG